MLKMLQREVFVELYALIQSSFVCTFFDFFDFLGSEEKNKVSLLIVEYFDSCLTENLPKY